MQFKRHKNEIGEESCMKVVFEYIYRDLCYGEVRIMNDRYVDAEVENEAEIELPPCNKKVKITVMGNTARFKFADGREICVASGKTPFEYCESYELFGDVREKEIKGTIRTE